MAKLGAKIEKPWGFYEDIYREDVVVFKKITVNSGGELSLQRHTKRGEFWYCVSGNGTMIYNQTVWKISPGYNVHIPTNVVHNIVNTGKDPLIIYEMQHGTCCEEDIVRLKDKYGR